MAAAESDLPRPHQEPHPHAGVLLQPGRVAAPPRLHHRHRRPDGRTRPFSRTDAAACIPTEVLVGRAQVVHVGRSRAGAPWSCPDLICGGTCRASSSMCAPISPPEKHDFGQRGRKPQRPLRRPDPPLRTFAGRRRDRGASVERNQPPCASSEPQPEPEEKSRGHGRGRQRAGPQPGTCSDTVCALLARVGTRVPPGDDGASHTRTERGS